MAPVILAMDVHCAGCAKKIRKSIENMLGVDKVWASPATGVVVVAGTADARELRRRIRNSMRRSVTIVRHGAAVEPDSDLRMMPHFAGMTHSAPPPPGYPPHGWGMMAPPPHPYALHPYAGNHSWAPPARRYVPNGRPTSFDDDEEVPETSCCSIQ